ncbi:MAG: type I 3-dehydroquinate dehydratase, partial [Acidobacteria bacterium]|nr:type I 3-dehydroquinate dehydratase [Acidobacteriota bacterium]
METQAARVSGSPMGYELRLDYLREFGDFEANLHQMLVRLHSQQVIATCRRKKAGGHFQGSVDDQVALLQAAARAGCHWVDIEIESLARSGRAVLRQFRPAKVMVSYHNYRRTPPLAPIYRRMARLPAQAVKVAGFARQLADNLRVFRLLKTHRRERPKLVALAQGASGIPSRLLALQWGCPFTYGAVSNHQGVASGQISVETMRSAYRIEHVDRWTQLYGVVGTHASMSLSPAMQNAAFQAKHVNAVYLPCETRRLSDFLKFARTLGFRGFSVTMPYKRAIIRDLEWLDPLATRIGACNTVAIQHGKWLGWNTDATAVIEVLTKRLRLAGSRILILGAGGAARAAAHALRAEDAEVFLSARRESVAQRIARAVSAQVVPWGDAEALDMDALINATPVGMAPHSDAVPIDLARLRVRVVFDMVYYPLE